MLIVVALILFVIIIFITPIMITVSDLEKELLELRNYKKERENEKMDLTFLVFNKNNPKIPGPDNNCIIKLTLNFDDQSGPEQTKEMFKYYFQYLFASLADKETDIGTFKTFCLENDNEKDKFSRLMIADNDYFEDYLSRVNKTIKNDLPILDVESDIIEGKDSDA